MVFFCAVLSFMAPARSFPGRFKQNFLGTRYIETCSFDILSWSRLKKFYGAIRPTSVTIAVYQKPKKWNFYIFDTEACLKPNQVTQTDYDAHIDQ